MKTRQSLFIIFSIILAGLILFLIMAFLQPEAAQAQNFPTDVTHMRIQESGDRLMVTPDPPRVNEPTELRVVLYNGNNYPTTYYAQFYWALFGLGTERFPIAGRLEFVLPPNAEGSTAVVWVPPSMETYSFYVDIFNSPEATLPVASFPHNVTFRGHPNPETAFFTEAVPILVRNPLQISAEVVLNISVPASPTNWEAKVYPQQTSLGPGEIIVAHTVFTYTGAGGLPPEGMVAFLISGTANLQPMGEGQVIFGPPLQVHMGAEPPYAEHKISANPYPVKAGEPTEICVEVRNVTQQPRQGFVFFRVAPFGIGLPFDPIAPPVEVFIPEMGIQQPCIHWVAPNGGQFAFEVLVETPGYPMPVSSQRVMDVGELLLPGTISKLHFLVRNPLNQPETISLGFQPFIPEWSFSLTPSVLENMSLGETRLVTLTVTVPADSQMPSDEALVADVVALAGSDIIGGFRKIYRPPVPIHQPADPIYAESEIMVRPYPPQERQPTEICVELRNPTPIDQVLTVDFNWAGFGIGLPWHLIRSFDVTIPAVGITNPCVMWVPPFGGRFGIEVGIHSSDIERIYSQRVIDVGEILLPNQLSLFMFPVGNPYAFPITVTLAAKLYLPQWEVVFNPPLFQLPPGSIQPVEMDVTPVQNPGDPEPQEGTPVIDVEAYWSGNGENGLLGGFRKLFTPPIPIHLPQDPPYAEGEISIMPYPPHAGEPTLISFDARNPTTEMQQITVTFEVANIGIGLPFTPIRTESVNVPSEGTQRTSITWVPPFSGEFCVRIKVEAEFFAEPFYSSRNISIVRLPQPYGSPEIYTFVVGDNGIITRPLTVTLGLKEYLSNWNIELGPNEIIFAPSQTIATSVMTITPPSNPDELPIDGGPIADISAYVNGELIGGIRKIWRPPVPLGDPQEPSYAESEIVINPDPPIIGQPATFAAQVRNNSNYTQTITIQFGWADFGFGIPFTSTNVTPAQTIITLGPNITTTVSTQWIPPYSGYFCVEIILTNAQTGEELHSQRNIDVIEVLETQCESIIKKFLLTNPTSQTVTVSLGSNVIDLPPGWDYSVTPEEVVLSPYESITATAVITPPCELSSQGLLQPFVVLDSDGTNNRAKIQVEGYDQNGTLVGGVELQLVTVEKQSIFLPIVLQSSSTTGDNDLSEGIYNTLRLSPNNWTEKLFWVIMLLMAGVWIMLKWSY